MRLLAGQPPTKRVRLAPDHVVGHPRMSPRAGDVSCSAVSEERPALSIGLAVRNGRDVVGRCIESVLSQDFADLELVICDNVSDDGTIALLEDYASSDPRIAFSVNDVNIGSHENMKRTLALSRGTFFRWISADDWLEPGCLSACVRALEGRPDAIGVTTWFTIHTEDGSTRYEEYRGEFPTSPDPARRFERMLWFFHAGDAKYDPVYGMYRREHLTRARPLRPSERNDWLLSTELALMGPIIHVERRLANRTRDYPVGIDRAAFRRRLNPVRAEQLRTSPRRLYRELFALAVTADLTDEQLRHCKRALRQFWIKEVVRTARSRAADARERARRRYLRPIQARLPSSRRRRHA
jgi:glycosyltransferase involved in cell wall biosynthesis